MFAIFWFCLFFFIETLHYLSPEGSEDFGHVTIKVTF